MYFYSILKKKDFLTEKKCIVDILSTVIGKTLFVRLLGFSPCEVIQEIMPSGALHRKR